MTWTEGVPNEGVITYGQLFAVRPFGNTMVVMSYTGEQIRQLLEQQFASGTNTPATPRVLFPSRGFSYVYDLGRAAGNRIFDMSLFGRPIEPATRYRVAMNSFLAEGGDNFSVFTEGDDPVAGEPDLDALEAYLAANSPVAPPATNRITRIEQGAGP